MEALSLKGADVVSILEVGFYGLNFLLAAVCGWVLISLIKNDKQREVAVVRLMVLGVCAFMVAILGMAALAIVADKYNRPVLVTFDIKPEKAKSGTYGITLQHLDALGDMVALDLKAAPQAWLENRSQATIVVENLFDRLAELEGRVKDLEEQNTGLLENARSTKKAIAVETAPAELIQQETGY